jgi:small subunit ribosomal protein S6
LKEYEITILLDAKFSDQETEPILAKFDGIVSKMGGTVATREDIGRKRLTANIGTKTEAHYYLLKYKCDNPTLAEVKRNLKLTEGVLRNMVIRASE